MRAAPCCPCNIKSWFIIIIGLSWRALALPVVTSGADLLRAHLGEDTWNLEDPADAEDVQASVGTPPPTSKDCGKKADIVLLVDSSGSVNRQEWGLQADFMRAIVKGMTIGENKVHYGVSVFATNQKPLLNLNFDVKQVDALPFADSNRNGWGVGRSTYMANAIKSASQQLSASTRIVPKIALMLTDGVPSDKAQAEREAAALKAKTGYVLLFVLIGSGIKTDDVKNMASVAPVLAPTFSSLPTVVSTLNTYLSTVTCEVEKSLPPSTADPTFLPTRAPTTTPAPTASPSHSPTAVPTPAPTTQPTRSPTRDPTVLPTRAPTAVPTPNPTEPPTRPPTPGPTEPTAAPIVITAPPSPAPSFSPSEPTAAPIPPCGPGECYCVSRGGTSCDGAQCMPNACELRFFCTGAYWCHGDAEE
jgi:hypothetical protein